MILTKTSVSKINLEFEIEQKTKQEKLDELLLVVPTNRKIRSLKKEIISQTPNKTTGKLNLETIGTLASNLLFIDSSAKEQMLSEAAAAVLLKQSFQETKLRYFSQYKKEIPTGTLQRIKNVISEYKKQGITPNILRKESDNLEGSEKIKAEDIADIYEKYLGKCKNLNVKEIGDVYSDFNSLNEEEIKKRFKELFPRVNLIIINGFDEFTSPEIEIINSLTKIENTRLFLSFDYYNYNPLVFSHLDICYNRLCKEGFEPIKDLSEAGPNKFQSIIREGLFKYNAQKGRDEFEDKLTVLRANSRELEIEIIAKEIKELITTKNIEPSNICVVFNLIQKYSPLVRDIFSLYGIPFNLTDRYSLSTSSPVVSIINFLEILENDFYYKNIFRALSGGYLSIKGIDLSNLLKASVKLKIISGLHNWQNSLSDAVNKLSSEEDEEETTYDKEIYQKALDDVLNIYEKLSPFDKLLTVSEFLEQLKKLIFTLGLPKKLINNGTIGVEENVKAVTSFLDEVTELLELLQLEYNKDEKFSLKFFLNNIRTAVGSSRYNIKEKSGYGVQVTTHNEIRGLKFDYLFIGGMCDGDFPTRYTPEIFFSGSYLRKDRMHQTEERYHFYQSLCAWDKKLYLSFPLAEERKELVESNFLTEFTSLFKTQTKDESNYADTIFTKEQMLKTAGKLGIEKFASIYENVDQNFNLLELKKALQINDSRITDPTGESIYKGYLTDGLDEEFKTELTKLKERNYSISQLETYAKCPYKYFAERILHLQPTEEPSEEIEALEMGSLLHVILYEFYTDLTKKKIILKNCDATTFSKAQDIIFKIAESKITEANFNSPLTFYEKEKILGINGNKENSLLYKFLEAERDDPDNFFPKYFEIGFGNIKDESKREQFLKDFRVNDVSLRGKIDRIDLDEDKQNFKVVDYKLSGKKPSKDELNEGISLQLPIYMFAAKKLIIAQIEKDAEAAGAEIYSLKFSRENFGPTLVSLINSRKKMSDDEKLEALIESNKEMITNALDAIQKYVEAIAEGKFNLSTLSRREEIVCRYCNFRPICRIQEAS